MFVNPLEFSIFLHKYDPKHHQIFIQVLKVDKENQIKQVREKYFLCHSLGLAVNLKVKLESICERCFQSVQ